MSETKIRKNKGFRSRRFLGGVEFLKALETGVGVGFLSESDSGSLIDSFLSSHS